MHDNISTIYQSEISRFVDWCDKNELIINTTKIEEIVFDPKSIGDHRQVVKHDHQIIQSQTFKNLGVYIDSSLTSLTEKPHEFHMSKSTCGHIYM